MPGKPIKIGPFTGGLNNISQSGEADDDEVVQLYNFEVENDNSLTTRPPMQVHGISTLPSTNTIGWDILGIYRVNETEWYLIASKPTSGATNSNTSIVAYLGGVVGPGETAITIKNVTGLVNRPTAMVQFKDRLYFLLGTAATDSCFSWAKGEPTGGTNVPEMKKGTVLINWKARLWVSGTQNFTTGDRVYFSTVDANGPQPTLWAATNFFDVAPGEGGFITALIPSFNNLLVFKTDGTWRFSYPSSPTDGQVDKINGAVGAANKFSVLEYENYIYVYDQGALYELVNSSYTQINRFVAFREEPFSVDALAPGVDLSIVNRRLIVRYFNALYVFNIETKTWSNWFSYIGTPGRFQELPVDSSSAASSKYIAASKGTQQSISPNLIEDADSRIEQIRNLRKNVEGGALTIESGVYSLTNNETVTSTQAHINRNGSTTDYDLPVSVGQILQLSSTVDSYIGTVGMRLTFLKKDGNTEVQSFPITAVGAFLVESVVPAGAILARLSLYVENVNGAVGKLTIRALNAVRKAGPSAFNLISIKDEYEESVNAIEFINAWVETKSYDYQASSTLKRLFYWAADVVTPRAVQAEARPVAKIRPVTWGELENYTWDQLEQGVRGSPLIWIGMTQDVLDYTDANAEASANGRFVLKLKKSLRFRQISYYIRMTTLGNRETGPAKLFSLTTYVMPKQDVVDKVS